MFSGVVFGHYLYDFLKRLFRLNLTCHRKCVSVVRLEVTFCILNVYSVSQLPKFLKGIIKASVFKQVVFLDVGNVVLESVDMFAANAVQDILGHVLDSLDGVPLYAYTEQVVQNGLAYRPNEDNYGFAEK